MGFFQEYMEVFFKNEVDLINKMRILPEKLIQILKKVRMSEEGIVLSESEIENYGFELRILLFLDYIEREKLNNKDVYYVTIIGKKMVDDNDFEFNANCDENFE